MIREEAKSLKYQTRKKKSYKPTKVYFVHDNGSRPFRVEVSGKNVEIYRNTISTNKEENTLIKKLVVKEVYLGKSLSSEKGNTILLHLDGKKYMFIGQDIYEFTMEDEFEAYYSIIGNSDVPYPIVLGSKYVYLMLSSDHTYIPRELFKVKMDNAEWANAYAYYYGYKDFDTGDNCFESKTCKRKEKKHKAIIQDVEKKMKAFKLIHPRL